MSFSVTATLAGGCSITGTLRGSGADASSLSSGDPCDALIRTVNDPSRPFECLVCGFRARFNSHMKVHTRIHTGYKPFACSVCDYRTTQKGNIKIHMTKKHGLPEDEVNLLLHGNISGAQLGGATIAIFQQLGQDSQNATSGNATSSHIHSSPSSFGATAVATSSASALASSSASLTVPSVPSAVSVLTCTGEILSSVRRVSTSLASASALGPSQQISTTPSPSVDARTYSVRSLAHADSASLQDPDDL
ncbi:sal-like protein 1 [Varroa jacobsoni]|uniref:C2H2-type domain-containing protein n=1 Tax=Varroa destructor TaxID=109461 RepID=A0A7M7K4E5_VARDE|nr:sal-like protein 1 [Varroa destructor]XP_022691184.1 sal-like protein 1 [Varroa jacobsoni]